jgi:3',5'-cyclic AMP phosphodiesterase CpdA
VRTIAQISDLHFGRHDPEAVDSLVLSLNAVRPDLVAISGDFTQRARSLEFMEARDFLDRIDLPKLVIPGNHDVPLYGLHRRFLSPLKNFNRYIEPAGVNGAVAVDEELAVLGLNTARSFTRKNGRVSLDQMETIKRVFAGVPPAAVKVLVTHHPLTATSKEAPVELAGRSVRALRAVAAAGVHVLLSGHHHRTSSGHADIDEATGGSVLVVHAGTATSTRLRGNETNTYNLIRTDADCVSVIVMEFAAGLGFRESVTTGFAFENGAWRVAVPPAR